MAKVYSDNFELTRTQEETNKSIKAVSSAPILSYTILEHTFANTSYVEIEHKLDREPIGVLIIGSTDYSSIKTAPSAILVNRFIRIASDKANKIKLYIF